ncbi:dicarboxylate/amino acid:cation symporter [Allorhodopirellula solitaria]|uniref:Proton glutamate symport protein n=1 Tax=Allorhodopirellula solitaria TaxID=2527987 RepID=A0A5C5XSQ5_9BACT|nr:dicarboxylate/amino acid:cation symporter [Allorhodopirellula solitaria]TWT65954.1 Proton glutamate symport protein [Allorhodopirellula solitaria]
MTDDPNAPKHSNALTYWIAGAIVAAIALALLWPNVAMHFEIGGELFLRSLKMIVVPLVFTSVMCGILGLGDVRRLGKPGAAAIGYYFCTTVLAVLVGLVVVNIIRPGVGTVDPARLEQLDKGAEEPKHVLRRTLAEESGLTEAEVADVFGEIPSAADDVPSTSTILKNLALMLVTDNLFQAAAETELLPIIVFTICFGALLTTMPRRTRTLTTLVSEANDALLAFVMILMKISPLGIFCLVTARFGQAQAEGKFLQEIQQIGWYFATVLIGLAIHAFIVLPLIFWIVRRENPYRYAVAMSQALLTAFSTASSSATLPVTLECAKSAGISKRSSDFVIPLGATINMDGTALYEAAAAIFIAQVIGMDLTLSQQAIVAVTATLAAIGAAGIPEAGLVTMLIVLSAVGLPLEYIGLILSVDWLLDRFRTAVNVFGDSVGAAVVAVTIPEDGASGQSADPQVQVSSTAG